MTDHERGAYSPQTDAPLAFDARQSGGGGGGFPLTLVISLVILALLVGAIFLFYRSGIRGAGPGAGPVGAVVDQIKTPPPASSQPSDQGTGLQIYKTETQPAGAPPAPAFAPPPEQPQPRPAAPVAAHPTAPVQTAQLAPAAKPAGAPAPAAAAAAAAGATMPAKPPTAPKDEIGALLDKSASAPAKPVQVAKADKPPVAAAPAGVAAGAGATAQIGAYSSEDLAVSGWNSLATAFSADMTGKGQHFEPVKTADGKTLYRATVTGFGSHAAAVAFCAKLKAASHACIVK